MHLSTMCLVGVRTGQGLVQCTNSRDGIGSVWVRIWHETGLDPRYCRLKLDPRFSGPGIILTLFRPEFLANGHSIELSPTLGGFLTFKPESTEYRSIFRLRVMQ